MTKISYVNGQYVEHDKASVSVDDRGYVFADGIYEVALVRNHKFIDWEEHCERLQRSLKGIRINYPVNNNELKEIASELIRKNNLTDAVVYLQVTRGVAPRNHPFPSPEVKPSVMMTVSAPKFPPQEQYNNGVDVITSPDLRWKLRNYKTISLLPNTLAKQQAVEAGAEEAILFEENGVVTEGSATNFFIITNDNVLQTHPENQFILGGITRLGILKVARENGFKVAEETFTKEQMYQAKEAFISSTTKHILPVSKIDGKNVGSGKPGETTKKLMECYREYTKKQIEG